MDYNKDTKNLFHLDDIIRIKENSTLDDTDRYFTAVPDMHRLKGADMRITGINYSERTEAGCVHAGGFSWHPADLYVVEHASKDPLVNDGQEGVFVFDPQCL